MTASKSSSLILCNRLSRMIPAQVTSRSSEPPCSTAAATAASTSLREVTSHATATPPIAAAVSSAAALSKSATTTSRLHRRIALRSRHRCLGRRLSRVLSFPGISCGRPYTVSPWSSATSSPSAGCTARSCRRDPARPDRAHRRHHRASSLRRLQPGQSIVVVTEPELRAEIGRRREDGAAGSPRRPC